MNPFYNANRRHMHPGVWSLPSELAAPSAADQLQLDDVLSALRAGRADTSKWVTIIGNPADMNQKQVASLLQRAGVDDSRVRWIRSRDMDTAVWATEQALLLNNSTVVLSWLGNCVGRNLQRAHLAAKVSQATSFLFTDHSSQPPLH
jgi:cell division inhibitor SulA